MKVKRESCRLVKPSYEGARRRPTSTVDVVPLSVFDTVTYDSHIAVIYAYRPPTPPNSNLEKGLATALSHYPEWAGRLTTSRDDVSSRPAGILLNDAGALFVEASVDCTLDKAMFPYLFRPSPALLSLHPDIHSPAEELVQVQLTRFTCGSLVVGFTAHHLVADGHATSNFLVAWGNATRGIPMDPLPLHGRRQRSSLTFSPRDPPSIEFEHRGVEFMKPAPPSSPQMLINIGAGAGEEEDQEEEDVGEQLEDVIVHKAHFTVDFLAKLKAKASASSGAAVNGILRPFSTFECLVAHLWRTTTRTRELGGQETTQVRISVNGRGRLQEPAPVPAEYFGNLVLWAFPRAKVQELLGRPLGHAAGLIRDAVARVNNAYFRSFVDFAGSGAVEAEGLVPTADMAGKRPAALCPNLEVDSWLRFPFYDLDFGTGGPYVFMPTYFPVEGMLFLLPSFVGDGSVDAFVPLFRRNLPTFKKLCYARDLV